MLKIHIPVVKLVFILQPHCSICTSRSQIPSSLACWNPHTQVIKLTGMKSIWVRESPCLTQTNRRWCSQTQGDIPVWETVCANQVELFGRNQRCRKHHRRCNMADCNHSVVRSEQETSTSPPPSALWRQRLQQPVADVVCTEQQAFISAAFSLQLH